MSDEVKDKEFLLHRSSFLLHRSIRDLRVCAVNRPKHSHSSLSRSVIVFTLSVSCLLLSLIHSSAQNPNETPDPRAMNLHQWGAVTLFHGLPSDRVRAIEQDSEGALWFGTDNGLARYDGRRTQTVAVEGLAQGRIDALKFDEGGALWIGTENGAAVTRDGAWRVIEETRGHSVTAIISQGRGRALMTTSAGQLYSCAINLDGTVSARAFPEQPLKSADADKPGALSLTSLAQGRGGVVYVGTHGRGLLAFDGERAREVLSRPRPFFVEALDADSVGHLWLGARTRGADGGLYAATDPLTENETASFRHVGDLFTATAVRRDARGDVWVATEGLGAYRFRDSQQVDHFTFENTAGGLRSNRVFNVFIDREGVVYAGTEARGVFRLRGGRVVERFTFAGTAGGLRSDTVNAVFIDREGVVWFGTDRGVCRYDPQSPRTETFGADVNASFVRSLYRTRRGELLAGTSRGLFVFEERRAAWSPVAELARRSIYSVAEDARGRLLVGTSAGLFAGVDTRGRISEAGKLEPQDSTRDEGASENAGDDAASAGDDSKRAVDDGQKKGVGEKGKAQKKVDARGADDEQARKAEGSGGESVRAIQIFRGATYIASYGRGVERVEGERRTLIFPTNGADARLREVTSLYAERDARLWIGTARAGAFLYEGGQARALDAHGFEQLRRGAVWAFDGSADRGLWIANYAGLFYYRAGAGVETVAAGVDARAVVAGVEASGHEGATDAQPAAWCATAGGGLLRVKIDKHLGVLVSRLDAEQGLASSYALLRVRDGDDGEEEEKAASGAAADERSNAQTNSRAQGDAAGGETLFVGTTRGLVRYRPGTTTPSLVAVRVLSRRLHTMSELQSGISLPYPQNSLALDVAALSSRTYPEQFTYAFVLRDRNGREVRRKLSGEAQFLMENLPPGNYSVEARAFTKDLVASAPLRFEFTVGRAPFPRTTVLLASLLALALFALAWGAWQNRKMARATTELAEANRQLAGARLNLANEAERERRRIARDLHDQTLADLRSLMLLTDQLPLKTNGQRDTVDPATFRGEIESISTEIRRICEDLSPSALDNVGLAAALEWALSNAAAHCPATERFEFAFDADEDLDERLSVAPGVRMQIYRIAQEAITNVCRHADARRVRLSVKLSQDGELLLALEDDGRGDFDPHERRARRGRGLAGIRDRASLIDAEVAWERREEGGTRFTLRKTDAAKTPSTI
jgi:signal transduction histidine kinase/ligand-binding sensor domain-containing protein